MSNPVVWFEVLGQDADKLRRFYGDLLGWTFNVDENGYGIVEAGDGGIAGGVGPALGGSPRPWTTFYTQVPDLERAVTQAEALGCRVLVPVTDLSVTRVAVVSDPEGNPVGLCAPAAAAS